MKSVDVKSSINIDFNKKINNEGPKYNVDGNVRKLKKLKLLCHVHILLVILKVNKFFEFLWKRIAKKHQKEIRVEKTLKGKGDKLHVKGKATIIILIVRFITKA